MQTLACSGLPHKVQRAVRCAATVLKDAGTNVDLEPSYLACAELTKIVKTKEPNLLIGSLNTQGFSTKR
ncbi:hypothetical protein DSO57_1005619 [Entomophthora muscae]|uniref:Uncharacterized protein n=1 Tax=Entomophthora muscae TaxID=34485 RepID=A0ACC2RMK8_9FUNG|nr:hypothetical protein DSO57_1005619 [Entomophthora muscae]